MGKKKSKSTTAETAASENKADPLSTNNATENDNDVMLDEEIELLQVDLGDMVKLKQVLDESVAAAVLELQPEDYRWDNFKLIIMFTACLFACLAQFAPLPFPESRPVLGVCGTAYFVLSGVLQLITTFIDKDSILLTLPLPADDDASAKVKNQDMMATGLRVRSSLPRFSEWYTVTIEFQLPEQEAAARQVHQRWSVGQFFDKEGYFDETGFMLSATELYHRFAAGQYNNVVADEKKVQ
jgi:signal peptidase complex subunit 2